MSKWAAGIFQLFQASAAESFFMEQLAGLCCNWPGRDRSFSVPILLADTWNLGHFAVAALICLMSLSFLQTFASVWMDRVKTNRSPNSPEPKIIGCLAWIDRFFVPLVQEWSRALPHYCAKWVCVWERRHISHFLTSEEETVVFHVKTGNVLSLSVATDHRAVRLLLSGWLRVVLGWDLKVNLMRNSSPVLFYLNQRGKPVFMEWLLGSTLRDTKAAPTSSMV